MSLEQLISQLSLVPLPGDEGGLYRQTYTDAHSSAIYYAIGGTHFSALHRLRYPEIWHFYAGAPVQMLLLDANGHVTEPVLGTELSAGQRPQVVVPAYTWQGAESEGEWSLLGTTMAPGYLPEIFELGEAASLRAGYPAARERIVRLARA